MSKFYFIDYLTKQSRNSDFGYCAVHFTKLERSRDQVLDVGIPINLQGNARCSQYCRLTSVLSITFKHFFFSVASSGKKKGSKLVNKN